MTSSVQGIDNAAKLASVSKDFRSDTITIPTDDVFEVMRQASRGDDVYKDDTTTNAFQNRMAKLTGKEAGLFCVSGTQTNQLALRTHLVQPPHSVLCDARAHVHRYEAGGIAFHSQAMVINPFPSNGRYLRWAEDIEPELILDENIHFCPTKVISLENTLGGCVYPQEEIVKISNEARKHGIIMHLDGARIWEAAAATGLSIEELCRPFDTISLCMSKGIGAPIGSVLVGPRAHINKAIHFRKLFGGGIRQAGLLSAAAEYCLDTVFPQLPRVQALARRLALGLADLGASIVQPCETNMVWWDPKPLGFDSDVVGEAGHKEGLEIRTGGRLVLHYQMNDETVDHFLQLISQLKEQHAGKAVPLSELEQKRTMAFAKGQPFEGPTTLAQAKAAGGYGANGPRGQ